MGSTVLVLFLDIVDHLLQLLNDSVIPKDLLLLGFNLADWLIDEWRRRSELAQWVRHLAHGRTSSPWSLLRADSSLHQLGLWQVVPIVVFIALVELAQVDLLFVHLFLLDDPCKLLQLFLVLLILFLLHDKLPNQ